MTQCGIYEASATRHTSLLALNEIIEAQRFTNIRNFCAPRLRTGAVCRRAIPRRRESCRGGGGGGGVFSEIISVFINSPTIPARFRDIGARLAAWTAGGCHGAARSIGLGNDHRY